jgi:hypothetical protein
LAVYAPELEREEEEKDPPHPPEEGSGGCAVASGLEEAASGLEEDEEPFLPPAPAGSLSLASDPGRADGTAPPPVVANDPVEVARVEAKAERLFPTLWFGTKVQALAADYPMAWVERALEDAHAAGVRDWRYVLGILRRLARDGGPRVAPAAPARRATADPELTVHRISPERAAAIEATYRPQPSRTPWAHRPGT